MLESDLGSSERPVFQLCDVYFLCVCVCVCVCVVELPPDDDSLEAGPCAGLWEHCGHQASRTDPTDLPLPRSPHQGGEAQH